MQSYQLELKGDQDTQTGARSLCYSLLSGAFRFPEPKFFESVKAGRFSDEVEAAVARLPYDGLKGGDLGKATKLSYEEFQSNYIKLFEVGGIDGAPCSLYEGEYGGGRMKVMEEILRFYHHFGLQLSTAKRDRPDHLATELEFMHLLTFKETEALLQGKEKSSYVRAQSDFLRYHVGDLLATVAKRVEKKTVPFYRDLVTLADGFSRKELAHLQTV